jgi:hypothetical protein
MFLSSDAGSAGGELNIAIYCSKDIIYLKKKMLNSMEFYILFYLEYSLIRSIFTI